MESSPEAISGEVTQLPQEFSSGTEEKFIVERYKALRLQCLQQEPEAFSSTYEDESQFHNETWVQRITNPSAKTFIAVRNGPEDEVNGDTFSKLSREWIGICVLIGPNQLDSNRSDPESALWAFAQPTRNLESSPTKSSQSTLSYCAVSMFVSPDQRRYGVGRKLVDAVIEGARKQKKEFLASRAYLTIFFEIDNNRARHLYGKWGFTMMDDIEDFPDKGGKIRPMGWGWILV